jgi:hypothetical protein
MLATPPAVNATTGGSEQAKTAPGPPAPGYGRRRGQAPLRRGAADRAQPAAAGSGTTGGTTAEIRGTTAEIRGTTAEIRGTRPRRFGFLLRRIPKTRATYVDPLFARPDLVEHDYYRFRRRLGG